MFSHRIMARLHNQEQSFNLRLYEFNRISVALGPIVLGLVQDKISLPGLVLVTQRLGGEQEEPTGRHTVLGEGHQLRVGRSRGLEIIDDRGNPDFARLEQLGGRVLQQALVKTEELSREHAQIEVVDSWTIKVKDMNSTNKTLVLGDPLSPEALRGNLRLVQ